MTELHLFLPPSYSSLEFWGRCGSVVQRVVTDEVETHMTRNINLCRFTVTDALRCQQGVGQ